MKKVKGVLITPNQEKDRVKTYELEVNDYTDYYKILDCSTFDIQTRKFGDLWLDIYCDDEGLFKEDNKVAIITLGDDGNPVEYIVGNVFIVSHNDDGDTISLTEEEIEAVYQVIQMVRLTNRQTKTSYVTPVAIAGC